MAAGETGYWSCLGNGSTRGIPHNDPDFHITTTRQRRHRALWEHKDGTVYIVFTKSAYCNSGHCPTRDVTDPGALTLLTFQIGVDPVRETTIHSGNHDNAVGIRREGNAIYVWAISEGDLYEYISPDEGRSWERTLIRSGAGRAHGQINVPGDRSARVMFQSSGSVWLYERRF